MANMALGIAPLSERQASRSHFIFGSAMGTFEDHQSVTRSGGNFLLSEEDFSLYTSAVGAFELVH
jgi:hypothetical protein